MNEFFGQLGIDWKLFLSQLVNFFLILIILRIFAYKPLIKMLKKRKDKIEEGLTMAAEASERLKEVHEISIKKLKETDEKCVSLLSQTDVKRKQLESEIISQVKIKEQEMLKRSELLVKNLEKQLYSNIQKEAGKIIESAIAKGVELEPDQVDKKLIKKAVLILEKGNEL